MSLSLNSDTVSLVALLVSLLAFLIAILQVIQQYASTAYDYRKCSARTMGGWATQTKRLFVPSEIRFEITYAVPHIELDRFWQSLDSDYQIINTPAGFTRHQSPKLLKALRAIFMGRLHLVMESATPKLIARRVLQEKYLKGVRKSKWIPKWIKWTLASARKAITSWYENVLSLDPEATTEDTWGPKTREDWFLSLSGAAPDAACGWLRLLHDTQATNLRYRITTKRLSIDYLPPGVTRPLATADLRALAVTLTYLGVQWKDSGANGIFVGRSPRNAIEITTTNVPSVGTVYSYDRASRDLLPSAPLGNQLKLNSDCMFNRFPLKGYIGSLLTWDKGEIRESFIDVFRDVQLADYFSRQYKQGGLNIGIGEFIASWCMIHSMPRRRYSQDKTESFFSASSLGCTFGMPLLSAILCTRDSDLEKILVDHGLEKEELMLEFVDMIKDHYASLEVTSGYGTDWVAQLSKNLKWASGVPARSNILFHSPEFGFSEPPNLDGCLTLMQTLDGMAAHSLDRMKGETYREILGWNTTTSREFGTALLRAYMEEGPASMQGPPDDKTKSPMREAVLLTVKASVKAADALSKQIPMKRLFWRNLIINRILRGVLWTICNGNAPGRDPFAANKDRYNNGDRSLECSLSSKLLDRLEQTKETVYIS